MDSTERGTGGFGSTGVKALQCVTGTVVPTLLYIEGIGPDTVSDDGMAKQVEKELCDDYIEMFDDESRRWIQMGSSYIGMSWRGASSTPSLSDIMKLDFTILLSTHLKRSTQSYI